MFKNAYIFEYIHVHMYKYIQLSMIAAEYVGFQQMVCIRKLTFFGIYMYTIYKNIQLSMMATWYVGFPNVHMQYCIMVFIEMLTSFEIYINTCIHTKRLVCRHTCVHTYSSVCRVCECIRAGM